MGSAGRPDELTADPELDLSPDGGNEMLPGMKRREFLRLAAIGTGAAWAGVKGRGAEVAAAPRRDTMVGLPISVAPLATAALDPMFDDMRRRGAVNALFPFIYTHEPHRSAAGAKNFHGGNHGIPHMQYYVGSPLTYDDMRAPEFGDVDVLARVIPVARQHGLRVFPFILEDNARPASIPHWEALYEVDHHGRRSEKHPGGPCYNNPLYQAFMLGLVEDYTRSYEIGGIMWGSERQSGLLDTLGLSQSDGVDPGRTTCFCEYCLAQGRADGIDADRARAGFGAIEKFVRASRAGERPRDGYFTAVWRLLLEHPEALAWGNLWVKSRHAFQASLYRRVKSINPALPVGWHVWQNMTFSPFQRAEENFADMTSWSDFLRPALYPSVAGERFVRFVKGARDGVLGDLPPGAALDLLYQQLNYSGEAPLDQVAAAGLSAAYVEEETRRAVAGVAGSATQIWPGLGFDIPGAPDANKSTPESVARSVKAVFHGGATGIILSRNYTEMKPENLSAAGAALRELGVA